MTGERSEEKKQHKHKLFGLDTRRENLRERAVYHTQKVYARPFSTVKHMEFPNINFSEHKILAAPRLAFQKVRAKKKLCCFSAPKRWTRPACRELPQNRKRSTVVHQNISGPRKRGFEFKGGCLHDGFGGFVGFGGSGKHLTLLWLVLQNTALAVLTVLAVSAVMAVSVMTATPLKLDPPFRDPEHYIPKFYFANFVLVSHCTKASITLIT